MNYNTYEEVNEIFRKVNCIGNDNCFFVTYKNPNSTSAAMFGAVGGLVSGMANAMSDDIEKSEGFIINLTEQGLGLIPLKNKGMQMVINVAKMEPQLDKFLFVPNDKIEFIEVKNFNFLNKKLQKVNIKIQGLKTLYQVARIKEKDIAYQEDNVTKLMEKYKK